MALDEQAWWKENPDPQVTQTADRLSLWNYPVGKTELVSTHQRAIRSFLAIFKLAPEQTGNRISVCGHASPTGEAAANVALAASRAQNVAKFLSDLGFVGFEVTSAGSSQPVDTAPTGQAMARNRRVEIAMSGLAETIPEPVPIDPPSPGRPDSIIKPTGAALTFEYDVEIPIQKVSAPNVEGSLTGVVKGKGKIIRGGNATIAAGLSGKNGALSAKFEQKLGEHLKGKIGIDPGDGGKGPSMKLSLADNTLGVPLEAGFQTSLNFFFFKVVLGTLKLPELDIGEAVVALEFSLELKLELGPSKALLARLGVSAGATGAVAIGVVGVAAVIIGGTIYASDAATARMLGIVADLAERDGAASQIAYECLGGTERVAVAMREHRLELTKAGGQASQNSFQAGRKVVTSFLTSLKDDDRAAKVTSWKTAFANNANETDFDNVRSRVLENLSPYQDDPPPLAPIVGAL